MSESVLWTLLVWYLYTLLTKMINMVANRMFRVTVLTDCSPFFSHSVTWLPAGEAGWTHTLILSPLFYLYTNIHYTSNGPSVKIYRGHIFICLFSFRSAAYRNLILRVYGWRIWHKHSSWYPAIFNIWTHNIQFRSPKPYPHATTSIWSFSKLQLFKF